MKGRTRQQRARDAASGLRRFTSEEEAHLRVVMLPYGVASLVLQCLMLVFGVCAVREIHRARHLGLRPLLSAAGGPLLSVLVLHLAQVIIDRRLSTWIRRLNDSPPD
jgi:hypothetical protein